MARTNAMNFTGGLQFPYATAATDLFKKEDVQVLAQAVDQHDHSTGKGLVLPVSAIPPITSAMITDGTITSADIADGTIVTADLADGAVTAWSGVGALTGPSTTSSAPVAISGMVTPSITTPAGRSVLIVASISVQFSAGGQNANLFLYRDATQIGAMAIAQAPTTGGGVYTNLSFAYVDSAAGSSLPAGAHTWSLYWSTNTGTLTLLNSAVSTIYAVDLRR